VRDGLTAKIAAATEMTVTAWTPFISFALANMLGVNIIRAPSNKRRS